MKLNTLLLLTGSSVLAISTTPLPSPLTQPSVSSSTPTVTLNLANPTVAELFLNNALRNLNGDDSAFLLHLPLEKSPGVLRAVGTITGTTETVKAVLTLANVPDGGPSTATMDVRAFVNITNTTAPAGNRQLEIFIAGSTVGCGSNNGLVEVRGRESVYEQGELHGSTEIGSKRNERHRRRAGENDDDEKRGSSSGGGGRGGSGGTSGGGAAAAAAAATSKSTHPSAATSLWVFLLLMLTVSLSLATASTVPAATSMPDTDHHTGKKKFKFRGSGSGSGSRSSPPRWPLLFFILLLLFIAATSASASGTGLAAPIFTDFAPQPTPVLESAIPDDEDAAAAADDAAGPEPTAGQIDFFGAKEEGA
ncbi:MAG: hypothetical protein Q9195_004046 [Heterodermia aff. obscurata]